MTKAKKEKLDRPGVRFSWSWQRWLLGSHSLLTSCNPEAWMGKDPLPDRKTPANRTKWPMRRSQWNSIWHFGASPATETQRLLIYPTLHMLLPQPQMSDSLSNFANAPNSLMLLGWYKSVDMLRVWLLGGWCMRPCIRSPVLYKLGVVVYSYTLSTGEMEAEGS